MIVLAKKIFQDEMFVGCFDEFVPVNCDNLKSDPKEGWLLRRPDTILEYSIVFAEPTDGSSFIKGVWVNLEGRGVLVDGTLEDFVEKCNSCCGEEASVVPVYNGTFTDIFDAPLKTVTVQRTDNGSLIAAQDALYAYLKYDPKEFRTASRNNTTGVTTYSFKTYGEPAKQGSTDVITETALTFDSNTAAALGANMQYHIEVYADGNRIATGKSAATSIANLVTALQADAAFTAKGTYSAQGQAVRLTTTVANYASLVITQIPV